MSDDGSQGLTVIAFIGSVFSPYYAAARRRAGTAGADPLNHCAINVALYGRNGAGWSMTERGHRRVQRDALTLQIGTSAWRWVGDCLQIDLDEVTVPWPSRLRGRVRVHAPQRFTHAVALAPGHVWQPIAPAARVEVELGAAAAWSGSGYLDSNRGEAPLESVFRSWDWSRAHFANGDSAVLYDVDRLDGSRHAFGLRFGAQGGVSATPPPPKAALPATRWRVPRLAESDAGYPPRLIRTLTDAPFYARSLIETQWHGERVTAFHESLSLTRFDTAWVQAMLPFRMPRRAG